MASRIEIIANACKATKNNAPTVEFDGSDGRTSLSRR
jgi:hypothetical protein